MTKDNNVTISEFPIYNEYLSQYKLIELLKEYNNFFFIHTYITIQVKDNCIFNIFLYTIEELRLLI